MVHPSYLLNPGDMFQVDIDRVLAATGRKNNRQDGMKARSELRKLKAEQERAAKVREIWKEVGNKRREARALAAAGGSASPEGAELAETKGRRTRNKTRDRLRQNLRSLILTAKELIAKDDQSGFEPIREEVSRFAQRINKAAARINMNVGPAKAVDSLTSMLKLLNLDGSKPAEKPQKGHSEKRHARIKAAEGSESKAVPPTATSATLVEAASASEADQPAESEPSETKTTPKQSQKPPPDYSNIVLTSSEQKRIADLLFMHLRNPTDQSKSYQTPWAPRPYMAPFAFIPRYLEVNQNVCAAVYLRHPVARPGLAEIPSPFPYEQNQLAFNWYLRRR